MRTPFTTEQFLDVIRQYNQGVWPAQIAFYLLAGLLIVLALRTSPRSDRWIAGILAFLWAWMGIVYHWLYFTSINPAAYLFAGLFMLQAIVFLAAGVLRHGLAFRFVPDGYGITGAVFLGYALILYPILGAVAGHAYPDGPTFGLPCPTTIATFGLLLWATRRVPLRVVAIPAAWSVVGSSAAIQFGIMEDYGLLAAGVLGTVMVVVKNRQLRQPAGPEVVTA